MGWASGSYLAQDLWNIVREHIRESNRKKIARKFYGLFCDEDADDWDCESQLIIDCDFSPEEN